MKIDLVSLDECPEGLFLFNGTLCFKSEYHTQSQATGYPQCDAYVVASGEYFWGGASTAKERDALLVEPVAADTIEALTAERDKLRARAYCAGYLNACYRGRLYGAYLARDNPEAMRKFAVEGGEFIEMSTEYLDALKAVTKGFAALQETEDDSL